MGKRIFAFLLSLSILASIVGIPLVTEDSTQVAYAASEKVYTLSFETLEHGSVTVKNDKSDDVITCTPEGAENSMPIKQGALVTLIFVPDDEYKSFKSLKSVDADVTLKQDTVNSNSDQKIYTFNMPAKDVSIIAIFEKQPDARIHKVQIANSEHGRIESRASATNEGRTMTFWVTPYIGMEASQVSVWTIQNGEQQEKIECIRGEDGGYSFTMPAYDVLLTAEYTKIEYPIYSNNSASNGVISVNEVAHYQDTVYFTVTPNRGYCIDEVAVNSVAGESCSVIKNDADNTYSFTMPADGVEILVSYSKVSYSISFQSAENGSLSTNKSVATYGENITVFATSSIGWAPKSIYWTSQSGNKNFIEKNVNGTYEFTMPDEEITLAAEFEKVNYQIQIESPSQGGIVSSEATTAQYGAVVLIHATPGKGYQVQSVVVMPDQESPYQAALVGNQYSFNMPASNVTISAAFSKIPYRITVQNSENGALFIDNSTAVFGDEVEVRTVPDQGWKIQNITVTDEDQTEVATIKGQDGIFRFSMPASAVSIVGEFVKAEFEHSAYLVQSSNDVIIESELVADRKAFAGDQVSVSIKPKAGYTIEGLVVKTGGGENVDVHEKTNYLYQFTMPEAPVAVSASYSSINYAISVPLSISNGNITVDKSAHYQDEVRIIIEPNDGYQLGSLTVVGENGTPILLIKDGNTEYRFVMPAGEVTVAANFVERSPDPTPAILIFDDVQDRSTYYYIPVYWAVEKEITLGTSDTTFEPLGACTRAQAVTFLWRAAGKPEPSEAESPFKDVQDPNLYYYKAVLWAAEKEITTGTEADTFSPEKECSRAQIVTFLWRYENKPSAAGNNPFTDVTSGDYYYTAALWASESGITTGTDVGIFSPDGDCTRAQIVTFLHRDLAK